MKSNMPPQKDFSKVPSIGGIQRSVFNRTHTHKTTFDAGLLVPFYVDEIVPGDSQDVKANIFARLSSPLDHPIMDNIHLDTHFFFVPNRIVWTNWKKFMGEREDPDSSIDFLCPEVSDAGIVVGSLHDYFGIPIGLPINFNSFHSRAYIKIYNEWFRDENLQDSITEFNGDGPESAGAYPIQTRGKRHDYFTSCLPFPQKTSEGVGIGLTGTVPVIGDGGSLGLTDGTTNMGLYGSGLAQQNVSANHYNQDIGDFNASTGAFGLASTAMGVVENGNAGLKALLDQASSILINDLRLAVATQQFLELDARGGTRYVELIKANFGVISPDYRLQRPEYLGGGTYMMNINPVSNTTNGAQEDDRFQATQAAYVTSNSRTGYSKSFTEHGVIIGLVSVRADLTYQQGMNKMFSRRERLDFYFPTFANLGEQAVLNQEIFYQDTGADDNVFGYQERWAEMRYYPSKITGKFRSDAVGTLHSWHLSQDFATLPVLGDAFIKENVPLDRVMQITDEPEIIMDSYIQVRHARPMPVYSVPGLARL